MEPRGIALGARIAFAAALVTASAAVAVAAALCEDRDGDGALAGAGCASGQDCNDQDGAVHPGAVEVCNGVDDNCDGDIDEGCVRTCPNFGMARRTIVDDHAANPRFVLAEHGWGLAFQDGLDIYRESSIRLDTRGERISPLRYFTDVYFPNEPEIAWTGSELAAAWAYWRSDDPNTPGVRFRRLGPWGKPPTEPYWLANHQASNQAIVWNGSEFAQLWQIVEGIPAVDGTLLERYSADGTVLQSGKYVTSAKFPENTIVWNGGGYAWAYRRTNQADGAEEIYFQLLDRAGDLAGAERQVTDHSSDTSQFGQRPRLVWKGPGRGYGMIWTDTRTGQRQMWFASLAPDGALVTPPGPVQVSQAGSGGVSQQAQFAWTGEEYLVVWAELPFPGGCGVGGPIKGARVSEAGAVLERRTLANDFCSGEPYVVWNGKFFGMAFEQHDDYPLGNPDIAYMEIDCNCTLQDADGDGVLPCQFGDCEPNDPTVATGKPELCADGKDNDCDGLVDCNDPDCRQTGSAPSEIAGVTIGTDKATVSWTSDAAATAYDIARGVLGDLSDMENFRWASCLASKTPGDSVVDGDAPNPGSGFYYLVRGRALTCLLGTWGSALRDDSVRECP